MIAKVLWLVLALAVSAPAWAQTPWVLVARKATQRVHHMQDGTHDFAAVILEAPADKVYGVALERARQNRSVMILMQDSAQRRLQLAEGDRTATLSVVEFSPDVSQLLIAGTAGPSEAGSASRVVAAVLQVCTEVKKTCQVEGR